MVKKSRVQQLYLYMNGHWVGTLMRQTSGLLKFSYHSTWLLFENARPISLSLPLREDAYEGALVHNFFENLLPDNTLIRERIQARFGAETNTAFDLLTHIGADCVGALQLLTQHGSTPIQEIQGVPLNNKKIAHLLKGYKIAPLGMDPNSDFRISIAGAQEKTALLKYKNKWFLPKGFTPTTHIIKLPIGYIKHAGMDLSESVENEWLCLKILKAYGLPVNEAIISTFEDMKVLVVKRFDREWINEKSWLLRLPQEDFCQVLGYPPGLKYESDGGPSIINIMEVLNGAVEARVDREKFMKTIFLFWVLGATDGHAKNFSVKLEAKGRYQLTPIYDVISAYPLVEKHQLQLPKLKMAMSLKGKNHHYRWNDLHLRHWINMATVCQFSEDTMKRLIEEVFDTMENVIAFVENILPENYPIDMYNAMVKGMRRAKDKIIF